MIKSADAFYKLRTSDNPDEYNQSSYDDIPIEISYEIINKYPNMKTWVIHNKKVPIEVLEHLSNDKDPDIRSDIAMKRKIIGTPIFYKLSKDKNENVRYALACNSKITVELFSKIDSTGSQWFQNKLLEIQSEKFDR